MSAPAPSRVYFFRLGPEGRSKTSGEEQFDDIRADSRAGYFETRQGVSSTASQPRPSLHPTPSDYVTTRSRLLTRRLCTNALASASQMQFQ